MHDTLKVWSSASWYLWLVIALQTLILRPWIYCLPAVCLPFSNSFWKELDHSAGTPLHERESSIQFCREFFLTQIFWLSVWVAPHRCISQNVLMRNKRRENFFSLPSLLLSSLSWKWSLNFYYLGWLIKPVSPKGNQSWIFTGRTYIEAETPILWPPDVKNWLIGKDPDAGKYWRQEQKGTTGWDGWMASPTQWTWVLASSGNWWWTGKSGMLQESDTTERLNWTDWF